MGLFVNLFFHPDYNRRSRTHTSSGAHTPRRLATGLLPIWNFTIPQRKFTRNYLVLYVFGQRVAPVLKKLRPFCQNYSFLKLPDTRRCREESVYLSDISNLNYSKISPTTPEPTVRPPSRIAKRRPFSQAIGVMSSTFMLTLSPGRHISTSSGRLMIPVTSVVLK